MFLSFWFLDFIYEVTCIWLYLGYVLYEIIEMFLNVISIFDMFIDFNYEYDFDFKMILMSIFYKFLYTMNTNSGPADSNTYHPWITSFSILKDAETKHPKIPEIHGDMSRKMARHNSPRYMIFRDLFGETAIRNTPKH